MVTSNSFIITILLSLVYICYQDSHWPWCFRFAISIGIIVSMIILSGITEVKTEECFSNIKNLNKCLLFSIHSFPFESLKFKIFIGYGTCLLEWKSNFECWLEKADEWIDGCQWTENVTCLLYMTLLRQTMCSNPLTTIAVEVIPSVNQHPCHWVTNLAALTLLFW